METSETRLHAESNASGISWSAVIAGAFVNGSLAMIFFLLGLGLGLALISPWPGEGAGIVAIGVGTVIWVIATHAVASGLGGYLAGRLRTKWTDAPREEVYFRDTAHGFLVWAVSVIITTVLIGWAISSVITSGVMLAGAAADNADTPISISNEEIRNNPGGYLLDSMILAQLHSTGNTPGSDSKTIGIPAEFRAPDGSAGEHQGMVEKIDMHVMFVQAENEVTAEEVEEARRALRTASLWMFAALLIGAFCASIAATIGGRQRDSING